MQQPQRCFLLHQQHLLLSLPQLPMWLTHVAPHSIRAANEQWIAATID
jgi:hypothetical protein